MNTLSIINIGFSIVVAAIFFAIYFFFLKNVNKSWFAVGSCFALLAGLGGLQLMHLQYFLAGGDLLNTLGYRVVLFLVPPMFYFFARSVLFPEVRPGWLDLLHLAPLISVFYVNRKVAVPLAFLIGAGYCLWLVNIVYRLRAHRKRFGVELFFFGLFAVMALIILILGFSVSYVDSWYFYAFYSNGIGLAFILVTASFIIWPDLLTELSEVMTLSYRNSTLKNVDVDACTAKLESLMQAGIYQNENLSLAMVADEMGLSSHQLSELINTRFGMNFSRYIRLQRVEEAKRLLKRDQNASILSISLEVGFKSQSNFYAAFREITGQPPGNFR